MARKTAAIVVTIVKVDKYSAYGAPKQLDGEPWGYRDQTQWAVPLELGAVVHDDVVITMTPDLKTFVSYQHAGTGKRIKL